MFFTQYDPMTKEAVEAKLAAKAKADNGSAVCCLKGLKFKAALEGDFAPESLSYEILDGEQLTVTENGVTSTVPYAATALGPIVMLTHQLPPDRGWHLVIDTRTWAITAFESWYGIEVPVGGDMFGQRKPTHMRSIPREAQRQYYFGWADQGNNEKPALHTTTNRIEGRGLHWDYSTGQELLTFFPSVVCCTLVELGKKMGGITMSNPADYIRIDDENYIFAHYEVEFGGKLWIEVMNFFEKKAIGLEYGFEECCELTYRFHTAELTITGDAAHMEPIGDFGNKSAPMASMAARKGGRYAYRPMDIDVPMPREEAIAAAQASQRIFDRGGPNIMASGNNLSFSDFLVGKKFKVKLDNEQHSIAPWAGKDGLVYEYEVLDQHLLRFRTQEHDWTEEKYVCYEPAKDIYFFSHMMTGDPDFANISQAIDFSTGLTTTIRAQIGNWHSEWEIGSYAKFGTLEYGDIEPPFARRHHFSNDLVGKCYAYAYSESMSSIHVYSSPESYSWTIFQNNNSGGATWSSPGYIIKLRNDAYILEWVEENCNGMMGLVVINPEIQHDGGFFFGVSHGGLSLNLTGAYMRDLGKFDILKYFER